MDKLMESPWFLKIISLLLALMLFTSVLIENNKEQTPNDTEGVPLVNDSEIIQDVPVKLIYDNQRYIVEDEEPDTVSIKLKGPNSLMKLAKVQKEYEVYADLQNLKAGTHKVKLQYRNISNQLTVSINPSTINVVIKEKAAKNLKVEVELQNKEQIQEGFTYGNPEISPNYVKVVGSKDDIDNVAGVKTVVDLKDAEKDIIEQLKLVAYDQYGNKMNLQIEPETVKVKVPIESPNKMFPLRYELKGSLPKGVRLQDITLSPAQIKVYGNKASLNAISNVPNIVIDISKITKDTTMTLDVPVPTGALKVEPTSVSVSISVEELTEETWNDIPVDVTGLLEEYELDFITPVDGVVSVTGKSYPSDSKSISAEDFHVTLDASSLEEGEHEVEFRISGPTQVQLLKKTINGKIQIRKIE